VDQLAALAASLCLSNLGKFQSRSAANSQAFGKSTSSVRQPSDSLVPDLCLGCRGFAQSLHDHAPSRGAIRRGKLKPDSQEASGLF
jgi:hypothetical protein